MHKTVVVIDSGGRGASLVAAYSKSPQVGKVIIIPGNDLIPHTNLKKNVETHTHLKTTSVKEIITICKREKADLVDVAQDNAVGVGLVDNLLENGFSVVGPTKNAGELEWNKAFSREFMRRHKIAQPEFIVFDDVKKGIEFLNAQKDQAWFVKAAGLCEGKGALPAKNNAEAEERIIELQKFGDASKTYLLEKWIKNDGEIAEEFSAFALSDGSVFRIVGYAQDHKRALDGDEGENTGGMGCSTPPLVINTNIKKQTEEIFEKTFHGMKSEGRVYKGVLYLGGIIIKEKVYVIEYNARWGDPEAEVIVPGLTNDFYDLGMSISSGSLNKTIISLDHKARVSVAVCAKGYPEDYSKAKGKKILGIEKVLKIPGVHIYPAGVKKINGKFVVNGGRVLHVVGEGKDVTTAREKAYNALKYLSIEGDNMFYRTDIGWRDLKRTTSSK